jgi:hypothetical protein
MLLSSDIFDCDHVPFSLLDKDKGHLAGFNKVVDQVEQ